MRTPRSSDILAAIPPPCTRTGVIPTYLLVLVLYLTGPHSPVTDAAVILMCKTTSDVAVALGGATRREILVFSLSFDME